MKYSLKSSFSRLVLAVFVAVFFVTILGRIVTVTGAWAFCIGWPLCVANRAVGIFETCAYVFGWRCICADDPFVAKSLA